MRANRFHLKKATFCSLRRTWNVNWNALSIPVTGRSNALWRHTEWLQLCNCFSYTKLIYYTIFIFQYILRGTLQRQNKEDIWTPIEWLIRIPKNIPMASATWDQWGDTLFGECIRYHLLHCVYEMYSCLSFSFEKDTVCLTVYCVRYWVNRNAFILPVTEH